MISLKRSILGVVVAGTMAVSANSAMANAQIRVVGSSTVYPFTTVVAEHFGRDGKYSTPIVESTGTGGGIKLFCSGVGEGMPDLVNASRAIKDSERKLCESNNVKDVTEFKIGFDGIVFANNKHADSFKLTKQQIFMALAREVPKEGKLVKNPYTKWNQISAALPPVEIEVYGPPPTSGTRDAFVELVMDSACETMDVFEAVYPDASARKKACQMLREDGKFIEAGENDNLIVQKLKTNETAIGIFGYSFLEQNEDVIQAALVNGVKPSFETIADESYSVSRPLFIYVKDAHYSMTPGLKAFMQEFVSERAMGEDGYLVDKGLVPLPEEELEAQREKFAK